MRVTLNGPYRLEEFIEAVTRLTDELAQNGVDDISRVNLYFQMSSSGRPLTLQNSDGEEIEHLKIDDRLFQEYRSVGQGISIAALRKTLDKS